MASFWYTPAKTKLAKALLDFDTVDLRAKLCMSNTTCDTEQDADALADFTLDEYDGSGYAEIDLAGLVVNEDLANDRAEIDVNDGSFGATVGAGTRSAVGMLVYVRVDGTAANDYPVAWIDSGGFPFAGNGGAINLTVNAEGLLQVA